MKKKTIVTLLIATGIIGFVAGAVAGFFTGKINVKRNENVFDVKPNLLYYAPEENFINLNGIKSIDVYDDGEFTIWMENGTDYYWNGTSFLME